MQQNSDKNSKLRDDNIDMSAKLKSVCQEFEKREMVCMVKFLINEGSY